MNCWVSADFRAAKTELPPGFRPWATDISAARSYPSRYIKKADRPTSQGWDFRVHLDRRELQAAHQFHHDWTLAGLGRPPYRDWMAGGGDAGERDGTFGFRTPKRARYAEYDKHEPGTATAQTALAGGLHVDKDGELRVIKGGSRSHEGHAALAEVNIRDMAKPRTAGKSVEQLVAEFCATGGTIKKIPLGMTKRWRAERVVEYCWPQGAPLRDVSVCDQPHAMPLHWSQARRRRIWRWARKALKSDEASLVERVVLPGQRSGLAVPKSKSALPTLKAALRKLADHYEKFSPAADLTAWEDDVRSNLEQMGVSA